MNVHSYKELIVWQKSIQLTKLIYSITRHFPKDEQFGLTSQIRRATISIPSNIAEGYGRRSHKEYKQFYSIAYGSALEVDTQIFIAKEIGYVKSDEFESVLSILNEIIRMLYVMIFKR